MTRIFNKPNVIFKVFITTWCISHDSVSIVLFGMLL